MAALTVAFFTGVAVFVVAGLAFHFMKEFNESRAPMAVRNK